MVAGVAALVVSEPAVHVTPPVEVVEPIEVSLLAIMKVFVGCPPHVRVTQQGLTTVSTKLI